MKFSTIIKGAGLTGVVSYLAYKKISDQMFKNTFSRRDKQDIVEQKYLDWLIDSHVEQVTVTSFDGLKLNAYDMHNHDTNRYMIMIHGISSSKAFMYPRAFEFDKLGYNILLIDQRAAGDSEGAYDTYGLKESQDLTIWIDYLNEKYPGVVIALFGLSMGAATVMMSSAYDLPDNVKCIVEDCGYCSLREELDHYIRTNYKISYTDAVLKMIDNKMKKQFGFSIDDVSPKECLEGNEIPILFVHGKDDSLVPYDHAIKNYNHNKGVNKFYPVPGAGHTECNNDPNYYVNISNFLNEYLI